MNLINKIVEIANSEDEDINNFIEEFTEKHGGNSIFIQVTYQEDDMLWGDIVGSDKKFPYHFEIKDICNIG